MIFFAIKLLKNVRTAVAGRKYPHQLAWAVAFGVLLGIIPHGNLLALATLIVVLSLKLNHAMAGLTAIGATFLATRLDPFSDQVGNYVLSHPKSGPMLADAWQLPLVPWTDLNNTVVMGSFLIGVGALIPIFMVTYPIFRVFAPAEETAEGSPATKAVKESKPVVHIDKAHAKVANTHLVDHPAPAKELAQPDPPVTDPPREASVDHYLASLPEQDVSEENVLETKDESENRVVETRIDVIRMKDYRDVTATADATTTDSENSDSAKPTTARDDVSNTEKPLDEALNYLLRQLRDSQQRKAG